MIDYIKNDTALKFTNSDGQRYVQFDSVRLTQSSVIVRTFGACMCSLYNSTTSHCYALTHRLGFATVVERHPIDVVV